ncbi:MAG: OmpA family protein [Myxococcales bacterium]|nr:OmpA family protein [Myxococcales bacterium]
MAVLACAFLAIGCGYSEEEMQLERDRIDQLTKELGDLSTKHAELEERFKAVASENASLNDQLQQMGMSAEDSKRREESMRQLIEQLRAKEQQAQKRLETFRNMLEKFNKMIASGKLRVRIVRNRMVVELSENILFDSGRADLKEEGQSALQEVATVLQSISDRQFQIAGHTDDVPIKSRRFPSNWHLATARAVTVTEFLAENGVDRTRLSAAGYAETQPVAANDTPEGRAQNRRIEIVLMPNLDELPDLSALKEDKRS